MSGADGLRRADDAGEPEDPGRILVPVATDDVPATVPPDHTPRFDRATFGIRPPGGAVVERARPAVTDGLREDGKGRSAGFDAWLQALRERRDLDPGRLELAQGA